MRTVAIVGGRTSARRKGPYRTYTHGSQEARQKQSCRPNAINYKAEQKQRTKACKT